MAPHKLLASAVAALDACIEPVARLEAGCCVPGRSPRMQQLSATIDRAVGLIDELAEQPGQASTAIEVLEDAGAQVGHLQVGCCAPDRMPLYAEILVGLMTAQRKVTASLRLEHGGTSTSS